MKLKYYLLISIGINFVLLYILLKPVEKSTEFERVLLDRIKAEYKADEERILRDSLRHEASIEKLNKNVYYIQKQRKNERNIYQLELSKIQLLNSDSSYIYIIDSLKQVCCSNSPSR